MHNPLTYGARVAVVGAGISGLASAYLLGRQYAVTLFEAASYPGGHTNTVDVTLDGVQHPVDTGFLVFNNHTYPNLISLFSELGVATHASDMSFSVSMDKGGLEWAGRDVNSVFAQRRNMLSPGFLRMLSEVIRFNSASGRHLQMAEASGCSLGQLLVQGKYSNTFQNNYLLPMASAIWSSTAADILNFPATTFLRFCANHGLLQIRNRPQWRTVSGGGREYVRRMLGKIADLRLNTPVLQVCRNKDAVSIHTPAGTEQFDAVVMASHAPQTLRMLADPSERERAVIGAIGYQKNKAILHTDISLLPRQRRAWSAWNYLGTNTANGSRPACVSYLINRLQSLPFSTPLVVTLNPICAPDPATVHASFDYEHPVFDQNAIAAQAQLPQLQGARNTWYAGAWTGYGFHEDGLKSALRVAHELGIRPDWAQL